MLESDNSEQAKASTEQEVQAALDYISRDLQQAIYIYGSDAIKNVGTLGIRDDIPPAQPTTGCKDDKCEPILAFWRRQLVQAAEAYTDVNPYVFSLVVYYHITGDQGANNSVWSKAARIGRFEIRDGVKFSPPPIAPLNTPSDDPIFYKDKSNPIIGLDKGFKGFGDNLKPGVGLDVGMNNWTKGDDPYDSPVAILLDHIDQSEWIADSQVLNNLQCPLDPSSDSEERLQRIPGDGKKVYGFYSCVNSRLWVAQTFIRGNSMFRVKPNCDPTKPECQYSEARRTFFPRATVQVRGQGFLDVR